METADLLFVCFILCAIAAIGQVFYYWWLFARFSFYKPKTTAFAEPEPVSVIIAARNEYHNLEKNLKRILEQDYPDFEVVVINDCSWDESQKLLEYYQEVYPHLKICQLIEQEKYPTGKKFALTIGIKAAKNDLLIFTDADCTPQSDQWLRLMQRHFVNGREIVLGVSPYRAAGSLLNAWIRYEAAVTALLYLSSALAKLPFMGVGRNLAYSRQLFFKHKGFAGHQHIASGDDDLFINEAATKDNVAIEISPESFMVTEPKANFEEWSRQKSRHNTTGKYYKTKHKVLLGTYYATLMLFYPTLILLLSLQYYPEWVAGIYGFKLLSQLVVFYFAFDKLKATRMTWFVPVFDIVYIFHLLVFGTKGLFTKNRKAW